MAAAGLQAAFPTTTLELRLQPKAQLQYGHVGWINLRPEFGHLVDEVASLMKSHVLVETTLDTCFALGYHTAEAEDGSLQRTPIGEEMFLAKYFDPAARDLVAARANDFLHKHPAYRSADFITFVPSHRVRAGSAALGEIASNVSRLAQLEMVKLRRTSDREPQKNVDHDEKSAEVILRHQNQAGSMTCDRTLIGRTIVVLDDLLETGASLEEAARALRSAGAGRVVGLAITKTLKHVKYS